MKRISRLPVWWQLFIGLACCFLFSLIVICASFFIDIKEAEKNNWSYLHRMNSQAANLEEFYNHIHRSILEKESHRNPYSVAVIYSYLYNKEHEVNRLTIAIECVRYGVQHDEAMRYICNS